MSDTLIPLAWIVLVFTACCWWRLYCERRARK